MDRMTAWEELSLRLENPNLLRHSLAVEAVMRTLADRLGEDEEQWGIAGLLHDIDLERVRDCPDRHGLMGAEILSNLDADPTVIYAVRVHNPSLGLERRRAIDKALYSADAAASLVVRAALSKPEKQLAAISAEDCIAAGQGTAMAQDAYRQCGGCVSLGVTAEELLGLALNAMTGIREELGL